MVEENAAEESEIGSIVIDTKRRDEGVDLIPLTAAGGNRTITLTRWDLLGLLVLVFNIGLRLGELLKDKEDD